MKPRYTMAIKIASKYLLLMVLFVAGCRQAMPPSAPHELLGSVPPQADRPSLEGQLLPIPTPGKITVVDFWSSYCAPCLESIPHLDRYWRSADHDRIAFVGVSLDEDPFQVRETIQEMGVTFPQVIDDGHILAGRYRVTAIPAAFLFDARGVLRLVVLSDDYDHQRILDAVDVLLSE